MKPNLERRRFNTLIGRIRKVTDTLPVSMLFKLIEAQGLEHETVKTLLEQYVATHTKNSRGRHKATIIGAVLNFK